MFGARDDGGLRLVDAHPVEEVAVHQLAGTGVGLGSGEMLGDMIAVGDHAMDRQPIFMREVEVALVVRRTAEDRAGAIVHQHIVHDPDGQMPIGVERMLDRKTGIETQLVAGLQLLGRCALPAA